jgi:transposase-like protein
MPRRVLYTEQQVRDAVASARSLTEALRTLGLRAAGGNFKTLRNLIERHEIDTGHFDPNWTRRNPRAPTGRPLDEILVVDSNYNRGTLKRRLFREGLKRRQCELCGQGEEWRGQPMALILDHINGVGTDNRLENLQIVCPNCAATLETHCGRNNKVEREPRRCLLCSRKFVPKYPTHRFCSHECGARSPKPALRKVDRPSYGQLLADLEASNFLAVGRKYGVSDNAVRKWLRYYERETARAGSHLTANPGLGGAGGETRDLGARGAPAANDEAVVLPDPVSTDDLDCDLRVDGKPALVERSAEVHGPPLA